MILSPFYPLYTWNSGLAMARNIIIYELSNNVFIAESNFKGGTWNGAIYGLENNKVIYVRKPEPEENNSNSLLISKGAIPVDLYGNISK